MDRSIAVNLPTLRRKILRSFSVMVALYGGLSVFILLAVYLASGITPRLIHLNYDSIAAAAKMREAWNGLRFPQVLSTKTPDQWSRQFEEALNFEEHNITEPGESKIAHDIREIWNKTKSAPAQMQKENFKPLFLAMNRALDNLVAVNQVGMFSLAETSTSLRAKVFAAAAIAFAIGVIIAILLADSLANRIAQPLKDIAEALKNKPIPGEKLRLPTPTSLELRILTHEMNQQWKRLSELRALNIEEIATQRSKLEVVLESVEDAIVVLDTFGNVLQSNQGLANLVGLSPEAINGHKWADLPTGSENYLKLRDVLVPNMPHTNSMDLQVDGKPLIYSARSRDIVNKSGDSIGTLYLLHDITERKHKDRLKSEFIAVLSHELKTPLQSLGTASELLVKRKTNMDEESQMLIDTVHEDVERIRAVAQDFIQVNFVDPHSLKLRMSRHPLSDLIPDWVKPFKLVARDKNVRIEFIKEGKQAIFANIDVVKFPWAISNLLSNAVRFSPAESTVTVSLAEKDNWIQIEIRDEGPGIPEGMRKKMFDPYFQVPSSESSIPSGFLGLGLTIAKEVVEAHQGQIQYLPGNPKGSIFRILLPIVPAMS